jgi:hypothetical protein
MPMRAILLLTLLQVAWASEPLRSGCSPDDEQVALVGAADQIEVIGALAGDRGTCYKVAVTQNGERLLGYVLGAGLPAIAAFERQRRTFDEAAHEAEARALATPPPSEESNSPTSTNATKPKNAVYFEEFSARDANGKPVSLSGLNGRVTLVAFWSPNNPRSINQLASLLPLYNHLHGDGLAAIGVSMDPNPTHINAALDDVTLNWPQIPDRSGLAARYQIDPKAGGILVLDSLHHIVASGPMGPDIEKAVHQLLAAPEASR